MSSKYNIYAAIFPNGKLYIGQTTRRLRDRREQHKNSTKRHSYPFYNAIKKYGWENVDWKVLFRTSSIEELNYVERWYINKFNTTNITNGYNLKSGGEGGKLHEKTKRKLSKIFSGENSTSAKIDWEQARSIRSEYVFHKPKFIDLANKYKLSRRQIGRILRNEGWVDKNYNPPKFKKNF